MKFVPVVAYHSCLDLPVAFSQPRTKTLADRCSFASSDVHLQINEKEFLTVMLFMQILGEGHWKKN